MEAAKDRERWNCLKKASTLENEVKYKIKIRRNFQPS